MGQVRSRGKKGTRYLADPSSYGKVSDHLGASAVFFAYRHKGPCTWKEAMDYAETLPDAPERSTLESWDARLKQMMIIVPEEDAAPREAAPSQEDGRTTEPAPAAARIGFWEHRERRQLDRDLAKVDYWLVVAKDVGWNELRKLAEQRRRSLLEAHRKG